MRPRELVCSVAVTVAALVVPGVSHAQSKTDVVAARKLFDEAVEDEEAKRFDVALEKFRHVQTIRDTTHVRYRIAACLEGLGKWRAALDGYEAARDLAENDPKGTDVVKAAKERTSDLRKRMPALTISLSDKAPASSEVRLDQEAVPKQALEAPLLVDPGTHEVSASAPGAPPFHTSITVAEGARLSLVIPLEPTATTVPAAGIPLATHETPPKVLPPPIDRPASSHATWGWIAVGTGGALLVSSGVVLLLRHNDIATLSEACGNHGCPKARETELTSIRARAVTEGPVAAVLAAGGVIASAVGVYLLVDGSSSPRPTADPAPSSAAKTARNASPHAFVTAFATSSAGGIDVVGTF